MPPIIDYNKCINCGICALICNSHIYKYVKNKKEKPVILYPEECWHCDACVIDCPVGAIKLRIPISYMLLYKNTSTDIT